MCRISFFLYSASDTKVSVYSVSHRLQERLCLVKAIKLFVLHHQEMSCIDDNSLQSDECT